MSFFSSGLTVRVLGTILAFGLVVSTAANAKCYEILSPGVSRVFTMAFADPADKLCVGKVRRLGGDYYHLTFKDKRSDVEGDLARFVSYTEAQDRCLNCVDNSYLIESGNAGGISFAPLSIKVQIKIPADQVVGKLILTDNTTGKIQEFQVR